MPDKTDTDRFARLERAVAQLSGALYPGATPGSLSPFSGARERAKAMRVIPDAVAIADEHSEAPLEHRAEGVA